MSSKEQEALAHHHETTQEEALPQYELSDPAPVPAAPPPPSSGKAAGPTAEEPFNFPSDAPPPAYTPQQGSSSSSSRAKPIAIPQNGSGAISPFILAYPPSLLAHGITSEGWYAFQRTISAFLTANVSERALAHAAEVGKDMVDRPVETAKHVYSHAKQVGKGIGSDAKRGNILGAAVGVIRGAVSIPVSAAIGLVHATVSAPLSTLSAVAKKPQTPRERAVAYLAVANRDWLQARGLRAEIMDSGELGDLVGASAEALVNCAGTAGSADAAGQLKALQKYLKPLEFKEPGDLQLGVDSLWLVLT